MDLVVVGCSGSFPGPDSPASCYLIEHEGTRILLDMGNGSLGALARYVDIYSVDAVILSHLHVDHFIDLCSFYVALRYRRGEPGAPVQVWGPADTGRRLAAAYGLRSTQPLRRAFDVRDLEPKFSVGPFTIKSNRVVHPVEAFALRVEAAGASIGYSGDTGPTEALIETASEVDLALFEASFLESERNPKNLHLTSREAAQLAERARARRLVLTHLVPWNDKAETRDQADGHFSGPLELASPGLRIKL